MNTTIKQTKKLPPLAKGSTTYKLIVPEKVEKKIRYLIRKFPSTEWSGVLFITHTGTFEDNDLVITCEDIYPMDLGTSGWTEFKMSEDVAAYMVENIELFDCDTALVHSHHKLGAFFSGQDEKMLQQEGNDTNCFVSLVVDTRGQYVARITRKVVRKEKVVRTSLGETYEFFGEGTKTLTEEGLSTVTNVEDYSCIEYYDLEVERHTVDNDLEYLDTRFEEIEKKKAQPKNEGRIILTPNSQQSTPKDTDFLSWLHDNTNAKELDFFEDAPKGNLTTEDEAKLAEVAMSWQPDKKEIHKMVVQMVTCSLILNPDKIDFKQWVTKHMVNMYKRIFGEESECMVKSVYDTWKGNPFEDYKDFIIEFMISNYNYDNVPDGLMDDEDLLWSRVATAMYNELLPYQDANVFMESYLDYLTSYMIE